MKNFRKALIPTIAMLLVAIISLTGVTYAWFTTTTQSAVTATGMKVKSQVSNNALFLQIKKGADADTAYGAAADYAETTATALAPVHPTLPTTTDGSISWVTKTAKTPEAADADTDIAAGTGTEGTNYKEYTYNLRNIGSTASGAITVAISDYTGAKTIDDSFTILVYVDKDHYAYFVDGVIDTANSTDDLASSIAKDGVLTVKVYTYFDGENSANFSNNASDSSMIDDITFTLTYNAATGA